MHKEHTLTTTVSSNNAQIIDLIDLLFAEVNVTSERSKFAALATALNSDSKVMRMITNL